MAILTLTSPKQHALRPLVEAALENQLRLLRAGIQRTEARLQIFEREYGFSSLEFLRRYENDELDETLDFVEWMGECRILDRLNEKTDVLREIDFAD